MDKAKPKKPKGYSLIIQLLETRDGRHHGFRVHRTRDRRMAEGWTTGGESNIPSALTCGPDGWRDDYWLTTNVIHYEQLTKLPHAGCHPDDIRAFVRREFRRKQSEKPKLTVGRGGQNGPKIP